MSTLRDNLDRFRLAWMRLLVVAVYKPMVKPLLAFCAPRRSHEG